MMLHCCSVVASCVAALLYPYGALFAFTVFVCLICVAERSLSRLLRCLIPSARCYALRVVPLFAVCDALRIAVACYALRCYAFFCRHHVCSALFVTLPVLPFAFDAFVVPRS